MMERSFTPDDKEACEGCGRPHHSGTAIQLSLGEGLPVFDMGSAIANLFMAARNTFREEETMMLMGETDHYVVAHDFHWTQDHQRLIPRVIENCKDDRAREMIGELKYIALFDGGDTLSGEHDADASFFVVSESEIIHGLVHWEGKGEDQFVMTSEVGPSEDEDLQVVYEMMSSLQALLKD